MPRRKYKFHLDTRTKPTPGQSNTTWSEQQPDLSNTTRLEQHNQARATQPGLSNTTRTEQQIQV